MDSQFMGHGCDRVDKLQQQIDRHPVGKMADHKQAGAQTRNLVLVRRCRFTWRTTCFVGDAFYSSVC